MNEQAYLASSHPGSAKLSTERIRAIEHAAVSAITEKGHAQTVRPHTRDRDHTTRDKDQRAAPISGGEVRGLVDNVDVDVSVLVIDPCDEVGAVEITNLAGFSDCRNGVQCAEIDHPLSAQLDRFFVRDLPRLRRWWLLFHLYSLPEASVIPVDPVAQHLVVSALVGNLTALARTSYTTVNCDRS